MLLKAHKQYYHAQKSIAISFWSVYTDSAATTTSGAIPEAYNVPLRAASTEVSPTPFSKPLQSLGLVHQP